MADCVVVTHIDGNSHRSGPFVNRLAKYMCSPWWAVVEMQKPNFVIATARKLSGKVMSSGGCLGAGTQH